METIGKPIKFGRWQFQRIIDNFGTKKIQIKYFNKTKDGKFMFNRFQALYCTMQDWKELKQQIKKKK